MATGEQTLQVLFTVMAREGASDLHLKVGSSPVLRINQRLCNVKGDPLTEADIWKLVEPLMTDRIRTSSAPTTPSSPTASQVPAGTGSPCSASEGP